MLAVAPKIPPRQHHHARDGIAVFLAARQKLRRKFMRLHRIVALLLKAIGPPAGLTFGLPAGAALFTAGRAAHIIANVRPIADAETASAVGAAGGAVALGRAGADTRAATR